VKLEKSAAWLELEQLLEKKILFIDGAMGTMVQQYKLKEEDYRGSQFTSAKKELKGNNDLLCITKPEIIREIHRKYLEAGADIIETNTFNATSIVQKEYGLESFAFEINKEAAKIATLEAKAYTQKTGKRVFVAGALGPLNKTLSLSPDVSNPAFRGATFGEVVDAYEEQINGLLAGGIDILLPETTFDTLNLKAALFAIQRVEERTKERLPLMISVTITDLSGRTLSGQNVGAFWNSIKHSKPLSIGLNCALGANEMRPFLSELSRIADCYISCYPNAGLPNPLSPTGYDETPESLAFELKKFATEKFINLVGGCCGTTPPHVQAVVKELKEMAPRPIPKIENQFSLSGLEPLNRPITKGPFLFVGERTNVTGSIKFKKCIQEKRYSDALLVAREQVENGANIIDVNFDEGMLESKEEMTNFLNLLGSEPDICRVPFMIDSSKWDVIEAGLKCAQGKSIVNSISLKEGPEVFKSQAKKANSYGAAVVVMAFDEKGQAVSVADKVRICSRAYKIWTEELGFNPTDLIFDPNILAIATGLEEHNDYAINFIEAVKEIKKVCPGALTSGGLSNLSFSFRGNDKVREAMHSVFLSYAIPAGLDMAIVNAGMIEVVDKIEPELRRCIEDVLFNKRPDATERLLELAEKIKNSGQTGKTSSEDHLQWRKLPVQERITHALIKGLDQFIVEDTYEVFAEMKSPLSVIEGPLMVGMKVVGELFGKGQMFLPQVVKSARVMKKAVAILEPHMKDASGAVATQGKVLLATVKGDVHDIGKNIVGVVLACNGYEVFDMGVMVSCHDIIKKAKELKVDAIGLSGLITPSLEEMTFNVQEFEKAGLNIPVLIGGATTSKLHTAVKVASETTLPVIHVQDASLVTEVMGQLMGAETANPYRSQIRSTYENLRENYLKSKETVQILPLADARKQKIKIDFKKEDMITPKKSGVFEWQFSMSEIVPLIDWSPLFWAWDLKGLYPGILKHEKYGVEATKVFNDAQSLLKKITSENIFKPKAVVGLWPANQVNDDDVNLMDSNGKVFETFCFLRQQREKEAVGGHYRCLADFVAPQASGLKDWMGAFAVTAGPEVEAYAMTLEKKHDDYNSLMIKVLGDRIAEALAELAHKKMREFVGYGVNEDLSVEDLIKEKYRGLRPAPGYPACPDHMEKLKIWSLLDVKNRIGAELTESYAIRPGSSVAGYYFFHPESKYFHVGKIGEDQVLSLSQRKNISVKEVQRTLANLIL
jgi:5-methyltetrahydrofolate--homocysteine methyltransferase